MIYSSDAASALGILVNKVHSRRSSSESRSSNSSRRSFSFSLPDWEWDRSSLKSRPSVVTLPEQCSSPIHSLPVELLSKILLYAHNSLDLSSICSMKQERWLLDQGKVTEQEQDTISPPSSPTVPSRQPLVTMSLVCHLWHEVITQLRAMPFLWTDVLVDMNRMKVHSERLRKNKLRVARLPPITTLANAKPNLNLWVHSGYDTYDDLGHLLQWGIGGWRDRIASYTEYSLASNPLFLHLYVLATKSTPPTPLATPPYIHTHTHTQTPFYHLRKLGLFGDSSTTSPDAEAIATIFLPHLEELSIGTLSINSLPDFRLPKTTKLTLWNLPLSLRDLIHLSSWVPALNSIVLRGVDSTCVPPLGAHGTTLPFVEKGMFTTVRHLQVDSRSNAANFIPWLGIIPLESVEMKIWSFLQVNQLRPPLCFVAGRYNFQEVTLRLDARLGCGVDVTLSDVDIGRVMRGLYKLKVLRIELMRCEEEESGSNSLKTGMEKESDRILETSRRRNLPKLALFINGIITTLTTPMIPNGEVPCPILEEVTLQNLPLDPRVVQRLRARGKWMQVRLVECTDEFGERLEGK
jgi:hypothetical protein